MLVRRGNERGSVNAGWLKSKHTFSFGHYFDPKYMGHGHLRVINDDYIEGGMGFDTHPHKNMEIITFVKEGALEHKDSLGTSAVIKPGEIQIMSAGSGIFHSEFNHMKDAPTTLYQIWIQTNTKDKEPSYDQKSYLDFLKMNELTLLVSPDGEGDSVKIFQDAKMWLGKFDQEKTIKHELNKSRDLWLQIVEGEVEVEGVKLLKGDGASFTQDNLTISAKKDSEFLLFEV